MTENVLEAKVTEAETMTTQTVGGVHSSAQAASRLLTLPSIDEIVMVIVERTRFEMDEGLQCQLGALAKLLADLSEPQYRSLVPLAQIAVVALMTEKPSLVLAKELTDKIDRRVHINPIFGLIRGGASPSSRVILGLGTLLYFALPALWLFGRHMLGAEGTVFKIPVSVISLVALSGAVGSIVSIMVRIRDFSTSIEVDPTLLFFTGFFKPVVGTAFALFVFAVLKAGILPITVDEAKSTFFFAAVAFVAGFSERFASDIASQTENVISSTSITKSKKTVVG